MTKVFYIEMLLHSMQFNMMYSKKKKLLAQIPSGHCVCLGRLQMCSSSVD